MIKKSNKNQNNNTTNLIILTAQISLKEASLEILQVKSTTDTSATGTLNAIPLTFPFKSGMTSASDLAAPVDEGMMFTLAPRPPRQSFFEVPSTTF